MPQRKQHSADQLPGKAPNRPPDSATTEPEAALRPLFPSYMRVSITDRCNFRCAYCVPPGGFSPLKHDDILRYEEIVRVARAAASAGVTKIRVTGGEPLVRRGVENLVAELASIDGIKEVCMTTNGSLLSRFARRLAGAGLSRVTVSLDSLRPDRFERISGRPALREVLRGIEAALGENLKPVKINTVVLAGVNDDEIPDFAEFADRPGVQVRFIEYMPLGADDWEERFISAAVMEERLLAAVAATPDPAPASGAARRMFDLPGGGKAGFIAPISRPFCMHCDRIRLTSSGTLRACLIADGKVDVRSMVRSGAPESEIRRAILEAFAMKPACGHGIEPGSHPSRRDCTESMRGIGG